MHDPGAATRYERQTFDSRNPLARFAHRTRLRRSIAMATAALPRGGTLVDFGAGSGKFLRSVKASRPDVKAIGIETLMISDDLDYRETLVSVARRSVDVLTCWEVCEHLSDAELEALIDDARSVLRLDGRMLISVPVMVGMAVPAKALNQRLFGRGTEWTLRDAARATLGLKVERPDGRRWSHRGFDFRDLLARLAQRFDVSSVSTSPIDALPWWLSSQVFIECRMS